MFYTTKASRSAPGDASYVMTPMELYPKKREYILSLPIIGRRLIPASMTNKTILKDTDQIIQTLNGDIRMLMVLQMAVAVIQE